MTEAKTEEETKFFRLIGEEMNDTKLEEILSNASEEQRKHLFSLVNYSGFPPVHWAVNYDSENCLKVLLKYGADPNLHCTGNDYSGMTALELSVRRRRRNCTAIIKEHIGFVPNNK